MVRYAVIGTSSITENMVKAAEGTQLELCGIYSRTFFRGSEFAAKLGRPSLKVFTAIEELAAAADIDAVYIASPNTCHVPQSELLLRAGKHILCEKPIALKPEDCRRLQGFAKAQGKIYLEAIMYLHTPARGIVLEALNGIGQITSAHFDFSQLSSRYDEYVRGDLPSVFSKALGGGAWNDLGIYCIYPALDFFGEPEHIAAHMQYLPNGADSAGVAIFNYSGFEAALTFSKTGQSHGVSQIMGTKGTVAIRSISQFQGAVLYGRGGTPTELVPMLSKHEIMRYEAQAFCDYILGRERDVGYERASELALKVSKGLEMVRQSATT